MKFSGLMLFLITSLGNLYAKCGGISELRPVICAIIRINDRRMHMSKTGCTFTATLLESLIPKAHLQDLNDLSFLKDGSSINIDTYNLSKCKSRDWLKGRIKTVLLEHRCDDLSGFEYKPHAKSKYKPFVLKDSMNNDFLLRDSLKGVFHLRHQNSFPKRQNIVINCSEGISQL